MKFTKYDNRIKHFLQFIVKCIVGFVIMFTFELILTLMFCYL